MSNEVYVATRLPKAIYEALLKKQKRIAKETGMKPTKAALIRLAVEKDVAKETR
jgi:hypothetical protein